MKKILVIGSGWEQEKLLKDIKEEGHYIVATHPGLNNDGFQYADATFVKDSIDIPSHLAIAKTYEVDAIVTDNCDFSLYTAAIIANHLNLPFTSIDSAILSNNKFLQRQRCQEGGVGQPDFRLVYTYSQLETAAIEIGFPLVIKPVDSRGTFGVTIVDSPAGLKDAYLNAAENSASHALICEQFIKGTLVTVDGFCFKNGHQALAVASRKHEDGPKPVTKFIIYPGQFEGDLNQRLMDNHNQTVAALGYNYGHTHGEYIVTESGDIYLVECANRGGGVYTSSVIVPELTGIALNKILLAQALGKDQTEVSSKGVDFMQKSIILTFLDYTVGKVIRSINVDEMLQKPYTLRFRSKYTENDMVESVADCAQRHSMLVLDGPTAKDTLQNLEKFKEELTIAYY